MGWPISLTCVSISNKDVHSIRKWDFYLENYLYVFVCFMDDPHRLTKSWDEDDGAFIACGPDLEVGPINFANKNITKSGCPIKPPNQLTKKPLLAE